MYHYLFLQSYLIFYILQIFLSVPAFKIPLMHTKLVKEFAHLSYSEVVIEQSINELSHKSYRNDEPVPSVGIEAEDGPEKQFIPGREFPQLALGNPAPLGIGKNRRTLVGEQFRYFGALLLEGDVRVSGRDAGIRGEAP